VYASLDRGTVKINDSPVISQPSSFTFNTTTQVKLEAIPNPGYRFLRWSGDLVGDNSSATLDMTCDKLVTAVFVPLTPVLSISKQGSGYVDPYVGDHPFNQGTRVNLRAVPDKGWKFESWTPNVDTPSSEITAVILNSDMIVTATFAQLRPLWAEVGIITAAGLVIGALVWVVVRRRKTLDKSAGGLFRSGYTSFLCRLLLGGVFIFAGFAKVGHINSLVQDIEQYQILPTELAPIFGHMLPYLEIGTGILLITGIGQRASAVLAGLLTLTFTIAKITAIVAGIEINVCNCFGSAVPLLATQSLALNFIMLVLVAHIIFFRSRFLSMETWFHMMLDRKKIAYSQQTQGSIGGKK
jgi:putative oxidoreductase